MLIKLNHPFKKFAILFPLLIFEALAGLRIIKGFYAEALIRRNPDHEGYAKAVAWDAGNSTYHYFYGRLQQYSLSALDLTQAEASYRRALALNPWVADYWLALAKVCEESGNGVEAEQALDMAVRINSQAPQLRWEAANFWLQRGDLDRSIPHLKVAAACDYVKLDAGLRLCWKITGDRERILREVIPDTLSGNLSYLYLALEKKDFSAAAGAWNRLLNNHESGFSPDLMFAYIDALVHAKRVQEAQGIWSRTLTKWGRVENSSGSPSGNNLIYNGGFENPPLNGAFDWRLLPGAGFSYKLDFAERLKDLRSLRIDFDGKNNIEFLNLYQIVPLEPFSWDSQPPLPAGSLAKGASLPWASWRGRDGLSEGRANATAKKRSFVLSYCVRTQEISSDQGLFWELIGYPDELNLHIQSEIHRGTVPWGRRHFEFEVDATIPALMLRLRRLPSRKLDYLLRGVIWLDDVALFERVAIEENLGRDGCRHATTDVNRA